MVIFNFIRDAEVGMFARAKRLSKEQKNAAKVSTLVDKELLDSSYPDSDKSD